MCLSIPLSTVWPKKAEVQKEKEKVRVKEIRKTIKEKEIGKGDKRRDGEKR
jgi:hypothetical protein